MHELPWNEDLMKQITGYSTRADPYPPRADGPKEIMNELSFRDGRRIYFYVATQRIAGDNCGARSFGTICGLNARSFDPDVVARLWGLMAWLPLSTTPRNWPYAKFTSINGYALKRMFMEEKSYKATFDRIRPYGWVCKRVPACAHPHEETYDLVYMHHYMDREDVYTLRGISPVKDDRGKEIWKFREWVNSISRNKIQWLLEPTDA